MNEWKTGAVSTNLACNLVSSLARGTAWRQWAGPTPGLTFVPLESWHAKKLTRGGHGTLDGAGPFCNLIRACGELLKPKPPRDRKQLRRCRRKASAPTPTDTCSLPVAAGWLPGDNIERSKCARSLAGATPRGGFSSSNLSQQVRTSEAIWSPQPRPHRGAEKGNVPPSLGQLGLSQAGHLFVWSRP